MDTKVEEKYMRRCIELARNGIGGAAPNPMVGAVIVADGRIIGEGYHAHCGEAHAEVNAVNAVNPEDRHLLKQATIYVSLEPCAHYGKTPPCADLIIREQIPRIVVGCQDSFDKVDGKGIRKLREAGREVIVGVLEEKCRALNKRFFTMQEKHRPFITLKWAQSADGFIDRKRSDGEPVKLSSPRSLISVHKLRAEHMAIMVGRRTALLDNPTLNVRHWTGKNPVRVVLDRMLSLPSNLNLFDGSIRTLVFTEKEKATRPNVEYCPIDFSQNVLPQVLEKLYQEQLQSLLVEGGSRLLQSFIDANLWDEIHIEQCPVQLGDGVHAPSVSLEKPYKEVLKWGRKYLIIYNFV